jgi:mRNA-degrading endonuclease YafQ of YafQ-DinJ toxin-antitoxin module
MQPFFMDSKFSARRGNVSPLKEALDAFLKNLKIEDKFKETYLAAHWEKIMGSAVNERTVQIYIKDETLFLEIDSAPLRSELLHTKTKLVGTFNKLIGKEIIKEIIFI